jgi:glycosyltransferase involved in cell wall biosynthesis
LLQTAPTSSGGRIRKLGKRLRASLASAAIFQILDTLSAIDCSIRSRKINHILQQINPQLVHAMRIPFEGIAAGLAVQSETPLIISVWGNDFTLFAKNNLLIGQQTRKALERASAMHTDCQRDVPLAYEFGFSRDKPIIVLPGSGGIRDDIFYSSEPNLDLYAQLEIPSGSRIIINPRGVRGYVRTDLFFKALSRVIETDARVIALCPGLQGNSAVEQWVKESGIQANVRLLPTVKHHEMADLFRLSEVTVSPATHDGTPNTLLEAMACGCFPVAGKIASVEEWITDGDNGLLFPVEDIDAQGNAILRALEDEKLRWNATLINRQLIAERAEYQTVMSNAQQFYDAVIRI